MDYVPSLEALPWPCCGPCEPLWGSTTATPGVAGPPPPSLGQGSRHAHRPPRRAYRPVAAAAAPTRPLDRQTLLTPSHHPGMPLVMAVQHCRTPLCPLHDLHAGALCSLHRVCMGRRGCPTLLPPAQAPTVPQKNLLCCSMQQHAAAFCGMLQHASSRWCGQPNFPEKLQRWQTTTPNTKECTS